MLDPVGMRMYSSFSSSERFCDDATCGNPPETLLLSSEKLCDKLAAPSPPSTSWYDSVEERDRVSTDERTENELVGDINDDAACDGEDISDGPTISREVRGDSSLWWSNRYDYAGRRSEQLWLLKGEVGQVRETKRSASPPAESKGGSSAVVEIRISDGEGEGVGD